MRHDALPGRRGTPASLLFVLACAGLAAAGRSQEATAPGEVFTLAGGLIGSLPEGCGGISVDRLGYTYVADGGDMVWRVSRHGDVEELARGFYGAAGNAIDAQGNLLQTNSLAGTLVSISRWGTVEELAKGLAEPTAVAVDGSGNILVATAGNDSISAIRGASERIVAHSPLFARPSGIACVRDTVYVVSSESGIVAKLAGGEVTELARIPGGSCGGIAAGRGALLVTSPTEGRVYRVGLDGDVRVLVGSGAPRGEDGPRFTGELHRPAGIAFAGGRLLVAGAESAPGRFGELHALIALRAVRLPSIGDAVLRAAEGGRAEDVAAAYRGYRSDPFHRGEDTEAEVVAAAAQLAARGQEALAIALLRAGADDSPESWRTHDALGAALAAAGDIGEAARAYRRSLAINPDGAAAAEAVRELRRRR